MKHKSLFIIIIIFFFTNCRSFVSLRDQALTSNVKAEEVKPGCYRQIGTISAVFKPHQEIVVEPASFTTEEVPARKETIVEKVIDKEGYNSCNYNGDIVYCREIPTTYKNITTEIEYPAYTKITQIPAINKVFIRPVLVEAEKPDIREVLCPAKATPVLIQRIQEYLKRSGFDPGETDGRLDKKTIRAIHRYEESLGLRGSDISGDDYIYIKTIKSITGEK